ncbi:MAG: 50S ribosomal protein L30 [Clostridiales bacterium]|jgi:large subunit ribosomal protein L30|nr:50S ribosomal protein L30 [Clostridiales bacterium]
MAKIKVTLKKSTIGLVENQKANVAALGLKKIGQFKIHNDTPHIRGMIKKVSFLLDVENIG